jgi:hypothetical protein
MSYFSDLSAYTYAQSSSRDVPTRNVGWLDSSHDFPTRVPTEDLLDRLWQLCLISVWPTRGLHFCPFCKPEGPVLAEQNESRILLGSAEVRVFDPEGKAAFASPNLVHHYVAVHHYLPPPEFLAALASGPQPATPEYRDLLLRAALPWAVTPFETDEPVRYRLVKRDGKVERERVPTTKD